MRAPGAHYPSKGEAESTIRPFCRLAVSVVSHSFLKSDFDDCLIGGQTVYKKVYTPQSLQNRTKEKPS